MSLFHRKHDQTVLEKIHSGAMIIDVRTSEEFMEGAYPGARNIPVDDLEGFLGEIGPKDKPLVVYCASGARSCQAAALLRMNGYADVTDVGGIGNMPAIGKN
jgi:phage shock protein E